MHEIQYMKFAIPSHFNSCKNSFMILAGSAFYLIWLRQLAGSAFYQIWLGQLPNMIGAVIIFSKMHFLLISANEFFPEIKRDGITSLHGIHDVQIYRPACKLGSS